MSALDETKTKNRHEKSISPVYGCARAGAFAVLVGCRLAHSPTKLSPLQHEHRTCAGLGCGVDPASIKYDWQPIDRMKTIFDRETEIGPADPERWGWEGGDLPNLELLDGRIMAHTRADLNNKRGVLKLEQHIYIRAGEHVLEQNWLAPEML